MVQVRTTAKIKIETRKEVIRTIKVYGKGLQFCVNQAWKRKISNNIKLHPFVYKSLRKRGLQSQLAVACIKQACGIVKRAKTKPIIKNTSIRYNFPRSASIKNNVLSIATIKGRIKVPFNVPECYVEYFKAWKVCESLLKLDRKGRCFFYFTFSKDVNTKVSDLNLRVLGIDVGVNNIAVTSDNRFFNSSKVKQVKRKFKHLRSKLQAKGTHASKKLLRKVSGREKRFMAWVNHNISKKIVSGFSGNKVIMENLKGIRKKRRGKVINSLLSNWSFFQLQNFIQYKFERIGVEVVRVKPNYTSQICSKCGKLGIRSKHSFSCFHCGFLLNADLNASRNLAHPKLSVRQADVIQPYLTCVDAKAPTVSVA